MDLKIVSTDSAVFYSKRPVFRGTTTQSALKFKFVN
jgi:hypothetical protein